MLLIHPRSCYPSYLAIPINLVLFICSQCLTAAKSTLREHWAGEKKAPSQIQCCDYLREKGFISCSFSPPHYCIIVPCFLHAWPQLHYTWAPQWILCLPCASFWGAHRCKNLTLCVNYLSSQQDQQGICPLEIYWLNVVWTSSWCYFGKAPPWDIESYFKPHTPKNTSQLNTQKLTVIIMLYFHQCKQMEDPFGESPFQ